MQRDFGRAQRGASIRGRSAEALPYVHTDGGVGIGWQVRNFHLRRWNRRCQDGDFYREHSGTRIEARRYRGLGQLEASRLCLVDSSDRTARTTETLLSGLATAMEAITTSDIHGWFSNAGYRTIHA